MNITVDTNLLVRALTNDHPVQARVAQAELLNAERVAIPTVSLCELAWVLARGYKIAGADIADAIDRITLAVNVVTDRPAVDAGLALLRSGGDFADGIIAFEGARMGGTTFVSFDAKAVSLLEAAGRAARLPRTH